VLLRSVERHAQSRVTGPDIFQAAFDKLCVDEFPYEGRSHGPFRTGADDHLAPHRGLRGVRFGTSIIPVSLHQCFGYPLVSVPVREMTSVAGPDKRMVFNSVVS